MSGASEEDEHRECPAVAENGFFYRAGSGRFVYIRKAFAALYLLTLRNLGNFEFAVKEEAIVNVPWVRLCMVGSFSFLQKMGESCYIYMLRGVICHCSFYCNGFLRPRRVE